VGGILGFLRSFLHRRRLSKQARRALHSLFHRPDLGQVSSLRRDHLGRAVLLGWEERDGVLKAVRFGIVRHPKPLPLPHVYNEVIEVYRYELETGELRIIASRNVTRRGPPPSVP